MFVSYVWQKDPFRLISYKKWAKVSFLQQQLDTSIVKLEKVMTPALHKLK